ncbi:MAG: hypothetical protein WA833_03445 [Nitrosotalea sp.]
MFELKVEILLPLRYNEDKKGKRKKIEGEKFATTFDELVVKFKGCTIDNTPLLGDWIDPDTHRRYKDENSTYWIVCKKTKSNMEFFRRLKKKLKVRFQQKDMMMYYVIINKF